MMKTADMPMIELNNGTKIPQIGLGVWEAEPGDEVRTAVLTALEHGYRLIDTAAAYGNEAGVGEAVREFCEHSSVSRREIFITTKLWNRDQGYDSALRAFDASLERLGTSYVDLYLIHWPAPRHGKFIDSWRALERIYEDGRAKAIGVSNFKPSHLEELQPHWNIVPTVNQIELHPYFQQIETRQFCEEHDIRVESYSPLQRGGDVLEEPVIRELADKYEKSPAQIILRWHIQEGLVVIPKSVTPERIASNVDIFDFDIHEDDIELIRELNRDERLLPNPDTYNVH